MKRFSFPLTERQRKLTESIARILVIGAGTKTGKSMALFCWLIRGMLDGQACCYVGPYFYRSRQAFDEIKLLLQPWILERIVKVNEARLQMSSMNGGRIDFISGDNPQTLYGQNFQRIVLDESSRMAETVYVAALTTISGTNGRLRMAFNLDLGSRNWSVRHLLRIQSLTPEERQKTGEDFMTFPTGGDGLVSDEVIQQFKSQMPQQLWEALYLARIPTEDCSLFRHLDKIFSGHEREQPAESVSYFLGIDLARKADFTACTVIDGEGNVVWAERFSQMDWSLQVARCALLYRTYQCRKAAVDSTGLGDPVAEQMEDLGMEVERYTFSVPSRKSLIEELILSCDDCSITVPDTERFKVYRSEMEAFEYVLDGSSIKYAAPNGMHDDTVMSLALAVHAFRAEKGALWGYVELVKRRAEEITLGVRDVWGEMIHPKPKPLVEVTPRKSAIAKTFEARAESAKKWLQKCPPCPLCKSESTRWKPSTTDVILCDCGAENGIRPLPPAGECCGNYLPQIISGGVKCGNCGAQSNNGPVLAGATKAQAERLKEQARHPVFGRRRWGQSWGI